MITGQIRSGLKPHSVPTVAAALQIQVAHARWSRLFGMPLFSPSRLRIHALSWNCAFVKLISDCLDNVNGS